MTAPDLVDALIGYRAWRPTAEGELMPWSVYSHGPWLRGTNTAACHGRRTPDPHHPPVAGCSCGLYALATLDDDRLRGEQGQVVGAIAAWGEIEVHRTGFRAEHAAIVALAIPPSADLQELGAVERCAAYYGVMAVPWDELPDLAGLYGMPIDPRLIHPPKQTQPAFGGIGERGIAIQEHVWAVRRQDGVEVGLTDPFVDLLDEDAEVTLPPLGTVVAAGDPLGMLSSLGESLIAWACVSGRVAARNEQVLDYPPGGAWLARIEPTSWATDAPRFAWGRSAPVLYAATVAEARSGIDVFADIRASRVVAGPPVRGPGDVLLELERRRNLPRFASANDVYATCAERMAERIAGDRVRTTRVGTANVVVRYTVVEPAATMTLVARDGEVRLICGLCEIEPDVELRMSAETASDYFAGRVDIARALRNGEIGSNVANPKALRISSLIKDLLARR